MELALLPNLSVEGCGGVSEGLSLIRRRPAERKEDAGCARWRQAIPGEVQLLVATG
jgi:hypothetical protein